MRWADVFGLELLRTFSFKRKGAKESSNRKIDRSLVIQHHQGKNDGADERNDEEHQAIQQDGQDASPGGLYDAVAQHLPETGGEGHDDDQR